LSFAFAPPFGMVSRNWSIAPFVRFISTRFDAANPFIDPATVRRDNEWITGVVFDTPLTRTFGLSTIVQYDKVSSTLPNFRQDNLSVMFGPTARF
jgi:predicted RNA-binding protein with PUA-like domain